MGISILGFTGSERFTVVPMRFVCRLFAGRALLGLLALCLLIGLSGCGNGRKTCYKVSGKVLVNGKPVKNVMVVFNPLDTSPEERLAPSAMTDDNGEFRLSTYDMEDGAPAGNYSVTFTWREPSGLLKNQFDGPDRLKNRYHDPAQKQFLVTVEKKPMQLDTFNLEMK